MTKSNMAKGQGKMETNEFGGKRESNKGRGRFDLIPYEAMEELAIWYEDGAEKYGDRNWEKGMSVKDCVNRMMRHGFKASNGWMDEGPFAHLVAVAWNALAAITMIKRYPERNDFWPTRYAKHFHPKETYIEDFGMAKWPEETEKSSEPFNTHEFKTPVELEEYQANRALASNYDKIVTEENGKSSDELFGHLTSDDTPFESLVAEVEHDLNGLGYETRQPLPKWEHDKKRVLTDKATAIQVHDIDHRLIFVLDFDSQEDLNEFRDNVAKMGIESTSK